MAYIDFAPGAASAAPALRGTPRHDPVPSAPAHFSALEWSVVALSRRDRLSSLRAPSRLSMALGSVFGAKHTPRLADEKLEALRRMAVLSWHHSFAVPASEVRRFLSAGYSADHYETLLASIGAARTANARRQA